MTLAERLAARRCIEDGCDHEPIRDGNRCEAHRLKWRNPVSPWVQRNLERRGVAKVLS